MDKSVSTAAAWLGPALACWATGEPTVAIAFVASLVGTIAIWSGAAK